MLCKCIACIESRNCVIPKVDVTEKLCNCAALIGLVIVLKLECWLHSFLAKWQIEGLLHSFFSLLQITQTHAAARMSGVKSPCGAHWNQVFCHFIRNVPGMSVWFNGNTTNCFFYSTFHNIRLWTVPISIPIAHNPESTFNSELVPANVGVLFYVFVVGMCVVASYFRSLICPLHLQLHLNERLSGSCRQMNESSLTDDRPCQGRRSHFIVGGDNTW